MKYNHSFISSSLYDYIKNTLKLHKIETYSFDAKVILSRALGVDHSLLGLVEDRVFYNSRYYLSSSIFNVIDMTLRRIRGIPLEYIVSNKHFYLSDYYINPSCFIPRYDTEILIEFFEYYFLSNILQKKDREIKILDFGIGSGNINSSILLIILEKSPILRARNLSFSIYGIEASKKAFEVACKNLFLCLDKFYKNKGQDFPLDELEITSDDNIRNKSSLIEVFYVRSKKYLSQKIKTRFDIIISNPPYLKSKNLYENKKLRYEPLEALLYNKDPLYYYKKLISFSQTNIKKQGLLIVETSREIKKDILYISKNYSHLRYIKSLKDSTKKQRVLVFKKII